MVVSRQEISKSPVAIILYKAIALSFPDDQERIAFLRLTGALIAGICLHPVEITVHETENHNGE
jgi:hypothetical protein